GGSGGVELTSLSDFEAVPGHGVSGTVLLDVQAPHERPIWRVHVGSPRFMRRLGAALGDEALVAGERLAAEGKTVVYVAVEESAGGVSPSDATPRVVVAAIAAVADPLKESSPATVAALKSLGHDVVMITGDDAVTAEAVARRAGIVKVLAEVLPAEK